MSRATRGRRSAETPADEAVTGSADDTAADGAGDSEDGESGAGEATEGDDTPKVDMLPVANVVEVTEAQEEKQVKVVPRRTVTSMRIGPNVYSFVQGTSVLVPAVIKPHLQEKGII